MVTIGSITCTCISHIAKANGKTEDGDSAESEKTACLADQWQIGH